MGAFSDFQSAVFKTLRGSPVVAEFVSTRIYDDVPHSAEAAAPSFPFITIGDQAGAENGADSMLAVEMEITLHAWSRAAGRKECLDILSAMVKALHDVPMLVTEGVVVYLNYASHSTSRDGDGETYHGQIVFTGFYQLT